jgi:lysophospholipase L1-like esterase
MNTVKPRNGGKRVRQSLVPLALIAIVFNRAYVRDIHHDWLNVIPLLATLLIAYGLWAAGRPRQPDDADMPSVAFRRRRWLRFILLFFVLLLAAEFCLRCLSYHRPLLYERQGDLLYTPVPNQEYVEKISLSHSRINDYGLRGGPVTLAGKTVILCLGDSVTFGYGLEDHAAYPAQLQEMLDQTHPGRFAVLNGGVDAYPVEFMRQKFLYLWDRGVHPGMVVVGYSFNEGGWIPQLANRGANAKERIAATVQLKNFIRGFALYNLLVENWGRVYYDRIKRYGAPARPEVSRAEVLAMYRNYLHALYDDLHARHVQVVFALFAGYDQRTGQYAPQSPFQIEFQEFAQTQGIPLIESERALAQSPSSGIRVYFQDQCHMTRLGSQGFSEALAHVLAGMPR